MRALKTIALLFMGISLLAANVASAAMPCCCGDADGLSQPTNMKADMPCHDMAGKASQHDAHCKGCKCLHGTTVGVLPAMTPLKSPMRFAVPIMNATAMRVHAPEVIFQPPKTLS